jgi:hypothetical protein
MPDKKLTALQEEIKLLKGEVKQSLASVRDYLLNMELPSAEISTILQALGSDGDQKITMRGSFEMPEKPQETTESVEESSGASPGNDGAETTEEEVPQDDIFTTEETIEDDPGAAQMPFAEGTGDIAATPKSDLAATPGEDALPYGEEDILPDGDDYPYAEEEEDEEGPAAEAEEEENLPGSGLDDDEGEPLAMDKYHPAESDILSSIPKVNMMANLINWVSRAIRDIGYDQLPVFLEVYGISGHLSPEMKDVIIHLAELTADKPEVETHAGIWSEQMLSLHGILTGGETPLHPVLPSWGAPADISDEITDEEMGAAPPEDAPVKLKLVFPDANGESREYSIDLAPGALFDPGARKETGK